jgi:hypothetical protein
MRQIEQEIKQYNVRKPIAEAIRRLSKIGFKFSGHGSGFGQEDFNVINYELDLYVNFCDTGRKCIVNISQVTEDFRLFSGTISEATKFIAANVAGR